MPEGNTPTLATMFWFLTNTNKCSLVASNTHSSITSIQIQIQIPFTACHYESNVFLFVVWRRASCLNGCLTNFEIW
jgi:hypothetical protein